MLKWLPYQARSWQLEHFTFFILKPDALSRHLVGTILSEIQSFNFALLELYYHQPSIALVREHYKEHNHASYFRDICEGMKQPPGVMFGTLVHRRDPEHTIRLFRALVGPAVDPHPDSLRGRFRLSQNENTIHSSDSKTEALRERRIWIEDFSRRFLE